MRIAAGCRWSGSKRNTCSRDLTGKRVCSTCSRGGSDFNYDFHATLDESVAPVEYNFQTIGDQGEQSDEVPDRSSFLCQGESIFHTYSVYARGLEMVGGSYYFLDETALGRQEDWEEPKGRATDARGAVPDFSS
jgi:predicted dithiol-disulfide oxidoreductase (DUF899 family)